MTHELKILPKWFNDVAEKRKRFEIRKADRDFKVGDWIILKEWEEGNRAAKENFIEILGRWLG